MTGHGQASAQGAALAVSVEIRSINSRYLKVNLACPDRYLAFQSEIEGLVRKSVQRGSISLELRVEHAGGPPPARINVELVQALRQQLQPLLQPGETVSLAALLALPGAVLETHESAEATQADWPTIASAVERALRALNEMRAREGSVMAADMSAHCRQIERLVAQVSERAPQVATAYSQRLTTRINQLLQQFGVTVSPSDLVREVGVFAERCDIAEELVRLASHCRQFFQVIDEANSSGRKLDFLVQEFLREANTIASKASDAEIAKSVIEIKTAIDRIREMAQNVE
jgi:uncharacterized protein (TIGR00255 family)